MEIETLGILDEIQALVSDKLQAVSYKWLSRNFSVSSNDARKLLEEFVDKYGNELEVVYSLSGWLKDTPSTYHIRLVSRPKLAEAKEEFDGNCSVQVYSVQACIPKDPAVLWNVEFVQAEDLFKQPPAIDNCLRDNRFCGILNSFVKRSAGGILDGGPQGKSEGVLGMSKHDIANQSTSVPQIQHKQVPQSSTKANQQSSSFKNATSPSLVKAEDKQDSKPGANKEKAPHFPPSSKKGQNDKNSSGSAGSLANMWGRASAKPKPDGSFAQATADAQISAREAAECESSDDDGQDFSMKRASNGEGTRKRRVVFDYSDEEDAYQDAVNLASPDTEKKPALTSKQSFSTSGLESNLHFEDQKVVKPEAKKVSKGEKTSDKQMRESPMTTGNKRGSPITEKNLNNVPETNASMNAKVPDAEPKRRKVLKTRIDERGREVTEVVWEGEEPETKSNGNPVKIAESNTVTNPTNRPPLVKKSPSVGNTGPANQSNKAGNKKAGQKDPKQGNILSFFKKA